MQKEGETCIKEFWYEPRVMSPAFNGKKLREEKGNDLHDKDDTN
jgi:hypothetical protein